MQVAQMQEYDLSPETKALITAHAKIALALFLVSQIDSRSQAEILRIIFMPAADAWRVYGQN